MRGWADPKPVYQWNSIAVIGLIRGKGITKLGGIGRRRCKVRKAGLRGKVRHFQRPHRYFIGTLIHLNRIRSYIKSRQGYQKLTRLNLGAQMFHFRARLVRLWTGVFYRKKTLICVKNKKPDIFAGIFRCCGQKMRLPKWVGVLWSSACQVFIFKRWPLRWDGEYFDRKFSPFWWKVWPQRRKRAENRWPNEYRNRGLEVQRWKVGKQMLDEIPNKDLPVKNKAGAAWVNWTAPVN